MYGVGGEISQPHSREDPVISTLNKQNRTDFYSSFLLRPMSLDKTFTVDINLELVLKDPKTMEKVCRHVNITWNSLHPLP